MYGKPPEYGWEHLGNYTPSKYKGDPAKDRVTALQNIQARAQKVSVIVKNSNYVVGQRVLVQLCSRAEGSATREWASYAQIIERCQDEDEVVVRYLNTNLGRPEGTDERVPVRLLCPLLDDVDLEASLATGQHVTKPHAGVNTRDTRVYVDKILLKRKIKNGHRKELETSYLVMFSGNTVKQAKWVLDDDLAFNQLSHVEELVCIRFTVSSSLFHAVIITSSSSDIFRWSPV